MSEQYNDFIDRIKGKLGIDLSLYKEAQMKRRIISLRNKRGFTDFMAYYKALSSDSVLLEEFTDRITINVSEFYRNPQRWDVLKTKVIPNLLKTRKKLTIWSAACSTGEEPYSLAMLFKEYFPTVSVQITATDLDQNILTKAQEGVYQKQALKDLPMQMQTKYFTEENGLYHIDPKIKQSITFKRHNLLADRYPQNMDLIVCRNVLIYFTDEAKDAIYQNFSNVMTNNGILFVGSTEQIFSPVKYGLGLLDTFFYEKQ